MVNHKEKRVVIISGPTGSGESTITREIVNKYPLFERLVTATSRKSRLREKQGVDYYFFSKKDFQEEVRKKNIVEHTYIENRDTYYGTYLPDLNDKIEREKNIIANVEHVGLRYYQEQYKAASIFIDVESLDVIAERIKKRNPGMETDELEKRLDNARNEIENQRSFYDYIVVNHEGKLSQTVDKIIEILKKEGYNLTK